nr:hypothetical protein CFP56_21543 [Quercus suber]
MKTRAKKTTASNLSTQNITPQAKVKTLNDSIHNPPRLFVLPKDTSTNARIISIQRQDASIETEVTNRYLVCPEQGFFELSRTASPKNACRSWLLTPAKEIMERADREDRSPPNPTSDQAVPNQDDGYILATPDLFVATAVDPLFIMLSLEGILWHANTSQDVEYLTLSDRIRALKLQVPHLRQLIEDNPGSAMENLLEQRTKIVCNELMMGDDEAMYAFSATKLAEVLLQKAKRMVKTGLPASLEEQFVTKTLDVPVLTIHREESSVSIAAEDTKNGSQSALFSGSTETPTSTRDTSTAAISIAVTQEDVNHEVHHLLQIRVALNYILVSYIPVILRTQLEEVFSTKNTFLVDFTPLDERLAYIASLKTQAQVLRSISDNVSRKRGSMDDEETLEKAEAKKRKTEEEEVKKKNVSHGLKRLMKADTSGMKKLSSFFSKGAVAKKA